MKLKLLDGFGIKVLYIVEINNYVVLSNDSLLSKIDISKCVDEGEFLKFINDNFPSRIVEFTNNINKLKQPKNKKIVNDNEYTICIHPSRRCNLHCKYCFGRDEYLPCGEIDIDTAKKAIDYIVFDYGAKGSMYTVDLSGSGEPLLRFGFIKELDEYCDYLRNKTGKQILIKFATNATLLTDEIVDYLKNSKCIIYGVSIDGNEKQNSNRQYKNGKSIYSDLIKGIEKINNDLLGLAVTITPNNEEVDEIYLSLYSLNVAAISMHYVRNYDKGSTTSLCKINMDNLLLHYNKLIDLLINHFKKGDYDFLKPLLQGDDYFGILLTKVLFVGNIPRYRCPAGRSKITVDEKGDLYACSVMNGNDSFYLGDIYKGIDSSLQDKFFNSNIEMSNKCRDCWCRNICAGECMANSYLQSKTFYEPNEFLCKLKFKLIPIAITFVEYLKINYPVAYLLIRNHAISSATYTNSDSATWSILKLLQHYNYKVTFSEVSKRISKLNINNSKSVDVGIHPKFVEKYLKSFNKKFNAVIMENVTSVEQIKKFPVIAYLNKNKSVYHQYILIEYASNDTIQYRNLKNLKSKSIETESFLNYISNIFIGDFDL